MVVMPSQPDAMSGFLALLEPEVHLENKPEPHGSAASDLQNATEPRTTAQIEKQDRNMWHVRWRR